MFDVVVVGARCAGLPTAMLLARKGYRVLCMDKGSVPIHPSCSYWIQAPGVAQLRRWGLLDAVVRAGCPAVHQVSLDFDSLQLSGSPRPLKEASASYCIRRATLDQVLLDAAVAAGAEVRDACCVQGLLIEDGRVTGVRGCTRSGDPFSERARLIVGADGMHSVVARLVQAAEYNVVEPLTCTFQSYWSGLPSAGAEAFVRPSRFWIAVPTSDDLTVIRVFNPRPEFRQSRGDLEACLGATFDLAPAFAERVRAAKREEPFSETADTTNYFRQPYGPGWALVGDAGYHRDPITAQGVTDAFRDAELLTNAIDAGFSGARSLEEALAEYHRQRDAAAASMYALTCELARLAPLSRERLAWLTALAQCPNEIEQFLGTLAGTVPIDGFYSPKTLRRLLRQVHRKTRMLPRCQAPAPAPQSMFQPAPSRPNAN